MSPSATLTVSTLFHFMLFLGSLCDPVVSTSPSIHVITVINADNPFYGLPGSAPIYEVAFETARTLYKDLFNNTVRTLLYQPGSFSCLEASALMFTVSAKISAAMRKYPDYWPAVFTPGCSLEVVSLGDFAREWDVPLISALASDQTLRDKGRYPTVVTFPAPDHQSTPVGVRLFLERYHWKTITFFCDSVSQYGAVATFYGLSWNNIKRKLDEDLGKYLIYQNFFDSKDFTTADYDSLLEKMKRQSRVAIFFTHPRVLRTFLIAAYRLNMTNGDYVFFNSQTTKVPTLGDVTWNYHDSDDQVAFEAFKSLILTRNPEPDWDRMSDILEQYANVSASRFNKTFTADQRRNDISVSAYESFMTFAKVLNETKGEIMNMTGRTFITHFWNRSFSYPSRDFYLGPTGMRVNDVVFSRLNITSGLMEAAWRYYAVPRTLETLTSLSDQWKSPEGPPPNEPVCGFLDNLCFTRESTVGIIAGTASALVLILTALLFGTCYWRNKQENQAGTMWWLLDSGSLHEIDLRDPKVSISVRAERSVCPLNYLRILKFREELVWLDSLCATTTELPRLLSSQAVRQTINTLRRLHQENVGSFLGLVQLESGASFTVFQYESRGSLRSLLQNDQITVDGALQSSLIWETISGLSYIHSSHLRCHGKLSSFSIMLDKRFCAKLCGQATPKFRAALAGAGLELGGADLAILWMPPEAFEGPHYMNTREGDMYTLGVIICEVLTKHAPLGTKFASTQSAEDSIQLVRKDATCPRIDVINVPAEILEVVGPCMDVTSSKRPTMRKLTVDLQKVVRRVQLVESLIKRLARYAQDLEDTVGHRTQELIGEQRKVDELLQEIIPKSLVTRLRNKEIVPAEFFEHVTILFSDIPVFGTICAVCTPLQTIVLLNSMYSAYDCISSHHDVYKVETVASGLPVRNRNRHASEIAQMALGMLNATRALVSPVDHGQHLELRIGMHTGPCAAGMVGQKMPRYCVFGDTMNTASRMESHGLPGKVHMSAITKSFLDLIGGFPTVARGLIPVKGKGDMETFWLKTIDE